MEKDQYYDGARSVAERPQACSLLVFNLALRNATIPDAAAHASTASIALMVCSQESAS